MPEPILRTRTCFTSPMRNELVEPFAELAEQTRISKTKIMDEAITDLLKKHNIQINEK